MKYLRTVNPEDRAKALFPDNDYLQQQWIKAVAWMRSFSQSKWVLDGERNIKWTE